MAEPFSARRAHSFQVAAHHAKGFVHETWVGSYPTAVGAVLCKICTLLVFFFTVTEPFSAMRAPSFQVAAYYAKEQS